MGQAKLRGTYEQRKAIAIARKKEKPRQKVAVVGPSKKGLSVFGQLLAAAAMTTAYPLKEKSWPVK